MIDEFPFQSVKLRTETGFRVLVPEHYTEMIGACYVTDRYFYQQELTTNYGLSPFILNELKTVFPVVPWGEYYDNMIIVCADVAEFFAEHFGWAHTARFSVEVDVSEFDDDVVTICRKRNDWTYKFKSADAAFLTLAANGEYRRVGDQESIKERIRQKLKCPVSL